MQHRHCSRWLCSTSVSNSPRSQWSKNVLKMSELSNVFKCHLCLHLPGFSNKKSTSQKHHSFSQDLLGSPDNFIKTAPSPERSSNASKRERSSASNNLPTKTGGIHYPETNSPLLKIDHPKRKCQGNIIFQPLISLSIRGHESWVDPVKSERYLTGEVQTFLWHNAQMLSIPIHTLLQFLNPNWEMWGPAKHLGGHLPSSLLNNLIRNTTIKATTKQPKSPPNPSKASDNWLNVI